MSEAQLLERKVSGELKFDGKILHVHEDMVRLSNGQIVSREVIRHIGAVCVIPVLDDGRVVMEHQFRYPMAEILLEIPAGKLDSRDENHEDAVRRELEEETGYHAAELIPLGKVYPACAYSDEAIWMYLAKGLTKGDRHLDEDEFLDVELIPLAQLLELALSGGIPDSKTQIAVLRAAVHEGLLRAQ